MNPSVTFTVFIQPPDLGACFSSEGNRANSAKGMASPMENPSMPNVGASMLPCVETATNRNPMIGPVHENETSTSVKAIRKMLSSPVVRSDCASIFVDHDEGSVSSKAPKKEAAKTTNNRAKKMLNHALVDRAFSALAPNNSVTSRPSTT